MVISEGGRLKIREGCYNEGTLYMFILYRDVWKFIVISVISIW
jgi:hypothetical protein